MELAKPSVPVSAPAPFDEASSPTFGTSRRAVEWRLLLLPVLRYIPRPSGYLSYTVVDTTRHTGCRTGIHPGTTLRGAVWLPSTPGRGRPTRLTPSRRRSP